MQSVEIESISRNVLYFLSFSFLCDNKFNNIQFSLGQLHLGYLHAGLWIGHFTCITKFDFQTFILHIKPN